MKWLNGWWPAILIVLAGIAAYWQSFDVPFVFDDIDAIVDNPSIRQIGTAAFPAANDGTTVSGRPVLNLSLALNYAVGGTNPWSYHAVNLLIHIGAGLALFGIIKKTMEGRAPSRPNDESRTAQRPSLHPEAVALGATLLWLLHPLQTESVTYIAQRAESLAGFFCLLTLYGFIRAAGRWTVDGGQKTVQAPLPTAYRLPSTAWQALSIIACLLAMGTKEVAAGLPLIVLLYDRTFRAGSFRAAWAAHKKYYVALACSWVALAALVAGSGGRGGSAGFDTDLSVAAYLTTQGWAILHYLRLAIWPSPLVFDYGSGNIPFASAWLSVAVTGALFLVTLMLCLRKSAVGFLAATFFILLAPSSSFVPVASQAIAEHRMYLALAPVVILVVLTARRFLGRAAWALAGAAACALAVTTMARNATYRTEIRLWQDTAAKWPANARAHFNVGNLVLRDGKPLEAIGHFERAAAANPRYPEAEYQLGITYSRLGRQPEAMAHYRKALEIRPAYPRAANNLALLLAAQGQWREAVALYRSALQSGPADPIIAFNLGIGLNQLGEKAEAIAQFELALRLRPEFPEAAAQLAAARKSQ